MQRPLALEYLHTLAKRTFKGHALYVAGSAPDFPQKQAVMDLLHAQITAQIFELHGGDTVLFFNNNKAHHLMLLALKIKGILGADKAAEIITSYNLKTSFSTLYSRVHKCLSRPETNELHALSVMQKIPHKPFTYEELTRALKHLKATSLTHLIRKQPVYKISAAEHSVFTTSWFVKNTDVRRTLMPAVDLTDNSFFTAALQEAVESKVFQKLSAQADWTGGLNVSVSFLKSTAFNEWIKTHTPTQKNQIFLDLSLEDILRHWTDFILLKEKLSSQGYRFIARLTQKPAAFNLLGIPADFVKIPATLLSTLLVPESVRTDVIVTELTTPESLAPLQEEGFSLFQGFIDSHL